MFMKCVYGVRCSVCKVFNVCLCVVCVVMSDLFDVCVFGLWCSVCDVFEVSVVCCSLCDVFDVCVVCGDVREMCLIVCVL